MSWNAHTDHIIQQAKISYLYLGGPAGGKWGESGSNPNITESEVTANKSSPQSSKTFGGTSYIFLREAEPGMNAYKKGDKSAASLHAAQYSAVAYGSGDEQKAEQCIDALGKLKDYLSGIGYN